jgi:hypothetical protein
MQIRLGFLTKRTLIYLEWRLACFCIIVQILRIREESCAAFFSKVTATIIQKQVYISYLLTLYYVSVLGVFAHVPETRTSIMIPTPNSSSVATAMARLELTQAKWTFTKRQCHCETMSSPRLAHLKCAIRLVTCISCA